MNGFFVIIYIKRIIRAPNLPEAVTTVTSNEPGDQPDIDASAWDESQVDVYTWTETIPSGAVLRLYFPHRIRGDFTVEELLSCAPGILDVRLHDDYIAVQWSEAVTTQDDWDELGIPLIAGVKRAILQVIGPLLSWPDEPHVMELFSASDVAIFANRLGRRWRGGEL